VDCDKTGEKSIQIFTPYERSFSLIFFSKNGWWGDLFYQKFWANRPRWSEIADFELMIAGAPQP